VTHRNAQLLWKDDGLVHRGALLEALSAGRGRKLTLLSAPAGWANTGDQAREALIDAQFSVHPLPEKSDEAGHAQLARRTGAHGLAAATDPRADGATIVATG
jgi:hypothetical protein